MFDLISLIKTAGYLGLLGIIFAESGLFIGFFLPGDSLLFTAGILASQGYFNIALIILVSFIGAVAGDSFGYYFGKKAGPAIFNKKDSLLFHKDHLQRAEDFYAAHGPKTIVIARFIPVVRTFAPILAGIGQMRYSQFLAYNIIGGIIWGIGMPLLGYFLGNSVPGIDRYIIPLAGVIIVLSVLPSVVHVLKDKSSRQKIIDFFKKKSI